MGGVGQVTCQGFLFREACISVLYFFSLECNEVSSSEFLDVYGFDVTWAACILKLRVCSCIAREFEWYVLLWNLLALGCWLVSV